MRFRQRILSARTWTGFMPGWLEVVGVVASLCSLIPHISLSVGEPINPDNMLTSTLTVENNGFFSIRNVAFTCRDGSIIDREGHGMIIGRDGGVWNATDVAQEIEAGRKQTLVGFCMTPNIANPRSAEIFLRVSLNATVNSTISSGILTLFAASNLS
jgi:hypothetical protein